MHILNKVNAPRGINALACRYKPGFDESRLPPMAVGRNVHLGEDAVVMRSAHVEVRLRGCAHR